MKRNGIYNNGEDGFLTPNQAATMLNISLSTLKKLIYQGKMKTFKTPGGHHRILKSYLLNSYKGSNSASCLIQALCAFAAITEKRRKFCRGHAAAVSEISAGIAACLGLSEEEIENVTTASLLHDIGMVAIPEIIINKETSFSMEDHEAVKKHPVLGADMLANFSIFADIAPIIKQHHERPDGLGYPCGLRNNEIRIESKIIALAEGFDCMTAEDSYKKPIEFEEAAECIRRASGSQFDPAIVDAFLKEAKNVV